MDYQCVGVGTSPRTVQHDPYAGATFRGCPPVSVIARRHGSSIGSSRTKPAPLLDCLVSGRIHPRSLRIVPVFWAVTGRCRLSLVAAVAVRLSVRLSSPGPVGSFAGVFGVTVCWLRVRVWGRYRRMGRGRADGSGDADRDGAGCGRGLGAARWGGGGGQGCVRAVEGNGEEAVRGPV